MASYFWYFESTKAAQELGFSAREAADTLFDTVAYIRSQILGPPPRWWPRGWSRLQNRSGSTLGRTSKVAGR